MIPEMIPIHPQTCPDNPDELRWVTPTAILPFAGRVATAPGPLGALLDDGTLAEVRVEACAVITRLGHGRGWPREGPAVRTALHAALAEPAHWSPAPADHHRPGQDHLSGDPVLPGDPVLSGDSLLRQAAQDLLDGPVGQFARSHGGMIELINVHDGVVEVRLGGTCDGCPAARVTMHTRLERQLREKCAGLREIRDVGTPGLRAGLSSWLPGIRAK